MSHLIIHSDEKPINQAYMRLCSPFFSNLKCCLFTCVTYLHECIKEHTHILLVTSFNHLFWLWLMTWQRQRTWTFYHLHLLSWERRMYEWHHNTLDAQRSFNGLASTFWLMISFIHYANGASLLLIQSMQELMLNWWMTFPVTIPQVTSSHFFSSRSDYTK